MVDIVTEILITKYEFVDLVVIEVLERVDRVEQIIKLEIIIENKNTEEAGNYSVVVIGDINSQTDPYISEVKQITQEIVEELTPKEEVVPECANKVINEEGLEVCLEEGPSGETDISTDGETEETPIDPLEPSEEVVEIIESETFQETISQEGEIRKIDVNPHVETLSEDVRKIIDMVKIKEEQLKRRAQEPESIQNITVLSIEEAANVYYRQYAITIRITYITHYIIRRHYFIRELEMTRQFYMGFSNLPQSFDQTTTNTRFFQNFVIKQTTEVTTEDLNTFVQTVNSESTEEISISNIEKFQYRVFPDGNYNRVTVRTQGVVGIVHAT
jgi:hypothetical protein